MTRQAVEIVLREWLSGSPYSQADLAEKMGICRAAVSRWCTGASYPSAQNARQLQKITQGEVPATLWPRRTLKTGSSPGSKAIWAAAKRRNVPIFALAHECSLPHRSLYRWAAGESHPHSSSIRVLNERLGLNLSVGDFEVRA